KLNTLFYMGEDDEAAHARGEILVCVLESPSVLDEIVGHLQLSHIVVVGGHPRKDRVGAYALGGCPAEIAHHDAVVVCARRLDHQLLKKGVLQIGELEELKVGRVVEDVLD